MTATGGTPQTAKTGASFQSPLQVQLINTNGCPVTANATGVSVTFTAPASGPSGTFATTANATATVGTGNNGVATAPQFSANDTPGSYTIVATSSYGTASFSMTNTAAGVAATVTATGGSNQSATVGATYANALTAKVAESAGQPVQGAPVTFTIASGSKGAGATFGGSGPSTNATTNSSGVATSPH
jgi:hypothetical protein